MSKEKGYFVISLDFELLYGMNDITKLSRWKKNAAGARTAIPQMLQIFHEYGIYATWAIVGMLYAENKEQWLESLPPLLPQYKDKRFSNYSQADFIGEDELADPLHYAPSIIEQIEEAEGQEIASHTFSHYYCMEQGQGEKEFEEDIRAALRMAEKHGTKLKSFVFPKNQFCDSYVYILEKYGITAVRGNEKGWMYRASSAGESLWKRAMRLADSYLNISGHYCYKLEKLEVIGTVINIPSSRFLRPFHTKLAFLEGWKLARIKGQMKHAAKHGKIFHLWWHPHNFGNNQKANMKNLRIILEYYKILQEKYGYMSITMGELSEMRISLLKKEKGRNENSDFDNRG